MPESSRLRRTNQEIIKRQARVRALHYRRLLMQRLGGKKLIVVKSDEINVIDKLLNEIGPRFRDWPGGYTRILKQTERRLGDAAPTAIIELLSASDASEAPAAPAPTVSES